MLDHEQLYVAIGGRIKRLRESAGMTQERLANILELKRTSITNIELGNQKPTLDTLYRLCDHFGVEISKVIPPVVEVTRPDDRSVTVGGRAQEVGAKTASVLERLRPSPPARR